MPLLQQRHGDVLVALISNPSKRNALERPLLAELATCVSTTDARVVIVAGDPLGGGFSAGFDISAIDEVEIARGLDPIREAADALEQTSAITIAAIDGPCMGGALELACACTLRLASAGARFCLPPARLGLVYSASGLKRFLRHLTEAQLARLLLTAETISSVRAHELGLVESVGSAAALPAAIALAQQMVALSPLALRGNWMALRAMARDGDAGVAVVDTQRALTLASEDLRAAVDAFRNKREPTWLGR